LPSSQPVVTRGRLIAAPPPRLANPHWTQRAHGRREGLIESSQACLQDRQCSWDQYGCPPGEQCPWERAPDPFSNLPVTLASPTCYHVDLALDQRELHQPQDGASRSTRATATRSASPQNVPQGLRLPAWEAYFMGLLHGAGLESVCPKKMVGPCWRGVLNSSGRGPSRGGLSRTNFGAALSDSICWYDWMADVLVIRQIWPAWGGT
jgi:hypothetical protein